MRLLLEAHHPAHIHFLKHAVREWTNRGDVIHMIGRDRDVMKRLLAAYDYIPSELGSTISKNNHFPLAEMMTRQFRVMQRLVSFKPDVVVSLMGSYVQSSALMRVPNVVFTDSEFQHFNHRIAHPFATRIYTPDCFSKDLGPKQRRYPGYHELAFLHPARFTPREEVLEMLGAPAGKYVIVRVSAWDTLHDVGQQGFGGSFDEFMLAALKKYKVFVVPERGKMPERWLEHQLHLRPDYFHDALAFANFVVTEGASTAAEAACLGVPAVYLNTTTRGYLDDIESRYGLVSNHNDARSALKVVHSWLNHPISVERRSNARQKLIDEHVDVTAFVVKEIDELLHQRR